MNLDSPELSKRAREFLESPESDLYLSAVSASEIALKESLGRLKLPKPAARYVPWRREVNGIQPLPVDEESALHLPKLPPLHSDPFDRMLVCQALVHGMALLTPDEAIARYPVRVVW
jgi:PIN domain nuclease of toxin-antitoxin system